MIPRILLVEFNKDLRENACEMLELSRYSVLSAENGMVGYDLIKAHKPDCIVCDLMLPDSYGDTLVKWIYADPNNRHIPLVIASSYDSLPFPINQMNSFMLRKPYTGNELVDKVKEAIYSKIN